MVWRCVLGHQSVEMFLKAILIGKGRRVIKGDVWGHDLLDLMAQVEQSGIRLPPEFKEDFRVFNSFFNELRYPSALKEVSGLGEEEAWRLERIVLVLRPLAETAYRESSARAGRVRRIDCTPLQNNSPVYLVEFSPGASLRPMFTYEEIG